MAKRKARKLLRASALAAGTMLAGCGSQAEEYHAPPGNPKGSGYDDEVVQTDMTQNDNLDTEAETPPDPDQPNDETDSEDTPPDPDMQPNMDPGPPDPLPLPANPKGSMYDDGMFEPPSK